MGNIELDSEPVCAQLCSSKYCIHKDDRKIRTRNPVLGIERWAAIYKMANLKAKTLVKIADSLSTYS